MSTNEIKLSNGESIWLQRVSGTVIDAQRSSEMSVHQGAARVMTDGRVIPGQISSSTTHHQEVWLRLASGRERSFDLVDFALPLRVGHELSLALVGPQGSEKGNYVGAYNHSTGDLRLQLADRTLFQAWKLTSGANRDFLLWIVAGAALLALFAYLQTSGRPGDKAAMAMFGAVGGAFAGGLLFVFGGAALTTNPRANALRDEIGQSVTQFLKHPQPSTGA